MGRGLLTAGEGRAMSLAAVAWWVGVAWAGCGALMVLVCIAAEVAERRQSGARGREAVEVAERHADGQVSQAQLRQALTEAQTAASLAIAGGDLEAGAAARACHDAGKADAASAAERAAHARFSSRKAERRE